MAYWLVFLPSEIAFSALTATGVLVIISARSITMMKLLGLLLLLG
jgi:hypothetical protein